MAKIYPLYRMATIIRKLENREYIPADEFVDEINETMGLIDDRYRDCTRRTLQRDFRTIEELFGITISCDLRHGYHISERDENSDNYESLLSHLDILSFIDSDNSLKKYIIAEHRQPAISISTSIVLKAIRECHPIEFEYNNVRKGVISHKRIMPHFLKESQKRWYIVGYDDRERLMTLPVDRMSGMKIEDKETFVRDESIDVQKLFRESFGIWNNGSDPVEDIILKYDKLDGAFLKTLPLHHSQEIIEEEETGIPLQVRLRITNDFVMEILSRSRSVEVIQPLHLRQRIHDTLEEALKRNI